MFLPSLWLPRALRIALGAASTFSGRTYYFAPRRGANYRDTYMSACISACISQKPHGRTSPNFCTRCVWPWRFGPPLTALRYVMYFRFCGWRHVFTRSALYASCVFLSGNNQNYCIDSNQISLNDKNITSIRIVDCAPWAKSAIYGCLVTVCNLFPAASRITANKDRYT